MENFWDPFGRLNLKLGSPSHSSRSPEMITEYRHWCTEGVKYSEWFSPRLSKAIIEAVIIIDLNRRS